MTDVIIGDDFTLRLNGMRDPDAAAGVYLVSATVTYTLYTAAGVSVTTGSLSYVAASSGNYRGVVESTVTDTLVAGGLYYVIFVLVQGAYNWTDRLDLVAKPPGGGILTPDVWSEITGIALDSTNSAAITRMVNAVSSALTRRCYPILLEPKTLTLAPFDVPPAAELFLPRPIRSITAVYLVPGANGDPSLATADTLLTNFTDYYSPATDVLTGWNRTGILYRRSGAVWGVEYRRGLGMLSAAVDVNRGAVFVSGQFGPTTVDPAVQEAAAMATTMLWTRRGTGMPLQSESWAGYSYSAAGPFTATAAVNSPEVTGMLMAAGVLPVHVA